jgi:hypothetical protein
MSLEYTIESAAWVITALLLWKYTPRSRLREAHVSFLFMQLPAWLLGVLVVEFGLLEYPVRLFAKGCLSSFTFEFFVLPSISVLYNLHFPAKLSRLKKLAYACSFPTAITCLEVPIEIYTDSIEYLRWHWSVTWISLLAVLHISYLYMKWFFRKPAELSNITP